MLGVTRGLFYKRFFFVIYSQIAINNVIFQIEV